MYGGSPRPLFPTGAHVRDCHNVPPPGQTNIMLEIVYYITRSYTRQTAQHRACMHKEGHKANSKQTEQQHKQTEIKPVGERMGNSSEPLGCFCYYNQNIIIARQDSTPVFSLVQDISESVLAEKAYPYCIRYNGNRKCPEDSKSHTCRVP